MQLRVRQIQLIGQAYWAIKTNTDAVDWADIDSIITTAGEIKAKTDIINWSDVLEIKIKADTILWTDITAIKTEEDLIKIETDKIQASVDLIKTKTDQLTFTELNKVDSSGSFIPGRAS